MKLRVAILEDEKDELKTTLEMLERFFHETKMDYEIETAGDAESFLKFNFALFDLVLLDIILQGEENGVDVAKSIRRSNPDISLMFITKTAQFAIDGYNVEALDYILKPLSYYAFALKMKKAVHYLSNREDKELVFKTSEGLIRLKENDILYFEVIRHYLYVHTKEKTYKVRGTMKEITEAVSGKFSRSGNSFLVNLKHVTEIQKQQVVLKDIAIPLTKNYKENFLKAFGAFMNKVES